MTFGDLFSEGGMRPRPPPMGQIGTWNTPVMYSSPMLDRGTYGSGGGKGKGKGKGKPPDGAIAALTLLAFMFFLNILQNCLKETMMKTAAANDSGVGVNIGGMMMVPGGPGGINIGGNTPGGIDIMIPDINAGRFRQLDSNNASNPNHYYFIPQSRTGEAVSDRAGIQQNNASTAVTNASKQEQHEDEKIMVPIFTQTIQKDVPDTKTIDNRHKVVYISTALKLGNTRTRRSIAEENTFTSVMRILGVNEMTGASYRTEMCVADMSRCYSVDDADALHNTTRITYFNDTLRADDVIEQVKDESKSLKDSEKDEAKFNKKKYPKNSSEGIEIGNDSDFVGGKKPKGEKIKIPEVLKQSIHSLQVPQGPPVTFVNVDTNNAFYGEDSDDWDLEDVIRFIPELVDQELFENILQDVLPCSPFLVCQAKRLAGTEVATMLSTGLAWIHPLGESYSAVLVEMAAEDASCWEQLHRCQRDTAGKSPLPLVFRLIQTFL